MSHRITNILICVASLSAFVYAENVPDTTTKHNWYYQPAIRTIDVEANSFIPNIYSYAYSTTLDLDLLNLARTDNAALGLRFNVEEFIHYAEGGEGTQKLKTSFYNILFRVSWGNVSPRVDLYAGYVYSYGRSQWEVSGSAAKFGFDIRFMIVPPVVSIFIRSNGYRIRDTNNNWVFDFQGIALGFSIGYMY